MNLCWYAWSNTISDIRKSFMFICSIKYTKLNVLSTTMCETWFVILRGTTKYFTPNVTLGNHMKWVLNACPGFNIFRDGEDEPQVGLLENNGGEVILCRTWRTWRSKYPICVLPTRLAPRKDVLCYSEYLFALNEIYKACVVCQGASRELYSASCSKLDMLPVKG